MASWREREFAIQAASRDHNEATARVAIASGGMTSFQCECGDRNCTCAIRLTAAEYEWVRGCATQFAIARNHENPESEQLISEHERFAVVETVSGEASMVARKSNPRRRND